MLSKAAERFGTLEINGLDIVQGMAPAAAALQVCKAAAAVVPAPLAGLPAPPTAQFDPAAVLSQIAASLAAGDGQMLR